MLPHIRHLPALVLVFTLLLAPSALDAKPKHRHHHHGHAREHKPASDAPSPVEVQSATIPWRDESTVYVHDRSPNGPIGAGWNGTWQQVVDDMNALTAFMPHAPTWVYINEGEMTCRYLFTHTFSGINICGEEPDDDYFWPDMAPAGGYGPYPGPCGQAFTAIGHLDGHVRGLEDGWLARIAFEATNSAAPGCANVYDNRIGIGHHEMAHAWLDQAYHCCGTPHDSRSAAGGEDDYFRRADFEAAEEWFGVSSVPYCDIVPQSVDC